MPNDDLNKDPQQEAPQQDAPQQDADLAERPYKRTKEDTLHFNAVYDHYMGSPFPYPVADQLFDKDADDMNKNERQKEAAHMKKLFSDLTAKPDKDLDEDIGKYSADEIRQTRSVYRSLLYTWLLGAKDLSIKDLMQMDVKALKGYKA